LQGKEIENYTVIYKGVNRYTRGQAVVMICTHKSKSNKTEYHKFCNDRIIEVTLKIHRGI
jgi:hypothetical protein